MDQEEDNLDTFYSPLEEDNGYDDVRILGLRLKIFTMASNLFKVGQHT